MSAVVDLEALGSLGFKLYGDAVTSFAGSSASDVGDVNNDGYDDFIVGAPFGPAGTPGNGSAYVIYGGPNGLGDADLGDLANAHGFRIDGHDLYTHAGIMVSAAGDVDGDGFDDVLVGAVNGAVQGHYYLSNPTAYVIYGGENSPDTIDLASLATSEGFPISIGTRFDTQYLTFSNAGDFNNDGFDDIVVDYFYQSGVAYVVFGRHDGYSSVDLENLGSSGFTINAAGQSALGASVSAAGDVNGDDFADIIISAPGQSDGSEAGAALVLFGHDGPFGTINVPANLSTISPTTGFAIQGGVAGDLAGVSVSSADVNGDGYSDLIVGAPGGDSGGVDAGEVYVIFGHAGTFPSVIDLSNLGTAGFVIQGQANDRLGGSVSGAGDVNGDGFEDVIVSGGNRRDIYLIYGQGGAFGTVDVANLTPSEGFVVHGAATDVFSAISGAGDIDHDGFDDLLIGSPTNDHNGQFAGAAYVIFGRSVIARDVRDDFNGDGFSDLLWRNDDGRVVTLLGQPNGSFVGNVSFDLNPGLDWHVEGTGDFNGDTFDDLVWRNDAGAVVTLLGEAGGSFIGNVSFNLNPGLDWHIEGTGDFNGDGFDDILWRNDIGNVVTLLGEAGGSFIGNVSFALNPGLDWHIEGTGDFNGDGFDDIVWRNDMGTVITLHGQDNGSFAGNSNFSLNPGLDWHVIGTGDFNGDGYDDILWRSDTGAITDLLGTSNGAFVGNVANLNVNPGLDWNVASIGDFDGDGRDDLVLRREDGQTIDWLGDSNGAFTDNSGIFSINPGTDWHVQPTLEIVI